MIKYNKYKNSGIEWIGEIPEHWEVKKLKYQFNIVTGFTPPSGNSSYYEDGNHIWVTIADMKKKYIVNSEKKVTDKAIEELNPKILPIDSLLYSFKLSVGKVAFNKKKLYTNEAIFSILPDEKINLNFYYYTLPEQVVKNANKNIYGATILNQDLIKNANLLIPPIPEQTAIANFLNRKTAEIDNLITKKEKLLELYDEEKTAIINTAVTKGINPNVKMKDSGVDWLGEIPLHWEVKKLKYLGEIVLGKMLTNSDKGNYHKKKYLRAANLEWLNVNIENVKKMWFSNDELKRLKLKENDLLVSEGGEVGRTCIWKNELNDCYIQNSVHKITLNENHNSFYFLYQFYVYGQKGLFESIVNRISIAHLTGEKIKTIDFIAPPKEEQTAIVHHIETETNRINSKITKTEKLIELLKEYKTALISEVVTGKIDVRNRDGDKLSPTET